MKRVGLPVFVRGDGCYLWDARGNRYLDGLGGILSVQIGYGFGEEMGQAALAQLRELPFQTNWAQAHPRAIELATTLCQDLAPRMQRAFFVSGGSEAVEAAWKLARQHFHARGEHRWKAIARRSAYHGVTLGALSLTGLPDAQAPFEPLMPGAVHVSNTNRFRRPEGETEAEFTGYLIDELEQAFVDADPDTVCMVILEPVQNVGGFFMPPAGYLDAVRAVCGRHGALLVADETIAGFGRLGAWFASDRFGGDPDIITCAKGLSSSYGSIGAVLATEGVWEPILAEGSGVFKHGISFGGAPLQATLALKNIEIMRREGLLERVRENEATFEAELAGLRELPIVGDVRGGGYAWAIELVSDPDTAETFSDEECNWLLRDFLSPRFLEAGLITRSDDRESPVIQFAPPLVAGPEEFRVIREILERVLGEAWEHYRKRR
jgi:adenosylmethionine-8-amino-7-oxononanoate aminotransferase